MSSICVDIHFFTFLSNDIKPSFNVWKNYWTSKRTCQIFSSSICNLCIKIVLTILPYLEILPRSCQVNPAFICQKQVNFSLRISNKFFLNYQILGSLLYLFHVLITSSISKVKLRLTNLTKSILIWNETINVSFNTFSVDKNIFWWLWVLRALYCA